MHTKDQRLLNEVYQNIRLEEQIQQELKSILLLKEKEEPGFFNTISDTLANFKQGVSGVAQNAWDVASLDIPNLITRTGEYFANLGYQAAGGGAGTYILGQALLMLVKKMNKEAGQNYDLLLQMLPSEVENKVKQLENMDKNSAEYKAAIYNIQKNSLRDLERALNSKGIQTKTGIFAKILKYMGTFFTSTAGSITGAIVIPILLQKMGFNPFPTFGERK